MRRALAHAFRSSSSAACAIRRIIFALLALLGRLALLRSRPPRRRLGHLRPAAVRRDARHRRRHDRRRRRIPPAPPQRASGCSASTRRRCTATAGRPSTGPTRRRSTRSRGSERKTVTLRLEPTQTRDRYSRLLAYVHLSDTEIAQPRPGARRPGVRRPALPAHAAVGLRAGGERGAEEGHGAVAGRQRHPDARVAAAVAGRTRRRRRGPGGLEGPRRLEPDTTSERGRGGYTNPAHSEKEQIHDRSNVPPPPPPAVRADARPALAALPTPSAAAATPARTSGPSRQGREDDGDARAPACRSSSASSAH